MTGAVLATLGAGAAGRGGGTGGGGTLGALAWYNIYDDWVGSNTALTIAGITSFHTLTMTKTGGGGIYYNLNGVIHAYTGGFNVNAGDTLGWQVTNSVRNTRVSGTITVNDASNGAALVDTFNYTVTASTG